ncbi:Conserved TM helix repeat-containing protein [Geitlerinema sp. PCC 7407]|nr:Conserved TM helix repeat-containing protein [Geitlerinema sp. PCC 7407]
MGFPLSIHLAQNAPGFMEGVATSQTSRFVLQIVAAVVILLVGWILAALMASVTRSLLRRTNVDNRVASWLSGPSTAAQTAPKIEDWIAGAVFWVVITFTVVAVLQSLQLTSVSEPLNVFLSQILGYAPKVAGAAALLALAWFLATIAKLVIERALMTIGLDEKLGTHVTSPPESPAMPMDSADPTMARAAPTSATTAPAADTYSLSETIANVVYWFIFLLFLPSVLSTLELQGTLRPVQEMLNGILGILPNVFAAVLIGFSGWLVAQVVRRIVTNLLAAAGTDRIGNRVGLRSTAGSQSLSWIIGTIVYVLVLIPTAIAALNALRIEAISAPAIAMLDDILGSLPKIFTAAIILVVAYVIGQFVSELVSSILTSLGFNNVFNWLGLRSPMARTPVEPPVMPSDAATSTPTVTSIQPSVPQRTPSEVVGLVALVGIMLFAAVAAVNVLEIEALTTLITGLVVVSGRVLSGIVVFAIGLYLANLSFGLIASSGSSQARILAQTARIAVIALTGAMALQQMGIATNIVNLAFGLLLGAIAVAIALAFGLGGRDVAAEQLREWLNSFKHDRTP